MCVSCTNEIKGEKIGKKNEKRENLKKKNETHFHVGSRLQFHFVASFCAAVIGGGFAFFFLFFSVFPLELKPKRNNKKKQQKNDRRWPPRWLVVRVPSTN